MRTQCVNYANAMPSLKLRITVAMLINNHKPITINNIRRALVRTHLNSFLVLFGALLNT